MVIGMDKDGNVLFIFSRAPYSGHDFANILSRLPISIRNAMYIEGGPAAALYFSPEEIFLDGYIRYLVQDIKDGNAEGNTNQIVQLIKAIHKKMSENDRNELEELLKQITKFDKYEKQLSELKSKLERGDRETLIIVGEHIAPLIEKYLLDKFGSYETGAYHSDNNRSAQQIPNVIGIVEKKAK